MQATATAFTLFYNTNKARINAHIRSKKTGLDSAILEDLVQDAWVKFSALYKPDMPTPIALIARLVNNELYSYLKKLSTRNTQAIGESQYSILDTDQYELKAETEAMEKALMQLPYNLYKPLYMFHYEGYKYEEIADILLDENGAKIPLGTIKHRIFAARERLSKIIKR